MAKTKVDDINRNIYDIKNKDDYEFKMTLWISFIEIIFFPI